MTNEIAKMLVLSTGHLTEDACNRYLDDVDAYRKGEYGWFVYAPGFQHFDDVPLSLLDCLGYAQDLGCDWIMFDCDGPSVDGLTYYEW